ncbi:uncharacterized protein K02A2.6-like [Sabethes cyaneus]|uniref:uncharacterized protein K02A2.6-like n=1 Tax=Sabethes cyaneus TaxID=53552 RepID=UPI00237DB622|nr:uncharacterized protein K02A2.6-like [Sabethes cyaneus]
MPPSRCIYTHIPTAFKDLTKKKLDELLTMGIIEKVTQELDRSFCSSMLVVPKGKDDIRLVIDTRGPNRCIYRTPFKMPTFESILMELHGARYFSTLDLCSAFFHVELNESCRHLANFFAGEGIFRYQRLPFGLCNAPDIFQEIMQTVILDDCDGTLNYMDDILVFGKSKEEHDTNLTKVLKCLRNHNVKINEDKCVFGVQMLTLLGFNVSSNGWKIDEQKIKAIKNFRVPESIAEVKSFLGLINFVERFIHHRVDKTRLLRELAKADRFYWNQELDEEFEYLKNEALKTITTLGYFNREDRTELYVDASSHGLGAVLVQFDKNSKARIIGCASKTLSPSKQKYPQTQREALAMVWGVERFSMYSISPHFTIRTDAESNEFIFEGFHRIGKRAVSRAEAWALRLQPYHFDVKRVPGEHNVPDALSRLVCFSDTAEPFDDTNDKHLLYYLDAGRLEITWDEIEIHSQNDSVLGKVRLAIETGEWEKELRRYECHAKELHVLGALTFNNNKVILPIALHQRAVSSAHQGYLHVIEMKRMDADATNEALNKVFAIWGYPLIIQSDNGPPFQSERFITTWEQKGVKIRKSIPLSPPQSNRAVERQNEGIKKALAASKIDKTNWKAALEEYVHIYNKVKPLSRLGVTPFELLVRWKFRGTFPCIWSTQPTLNLDRENVKEMDAYSKLESKQYADQKRNAKSSDIEVGDKVFLAQFKKMKSDPNFGSEKFVVIARRGAILVVRSERGVLYSRNVQDAKRIPKCDDENDQMEIVEKRIAEDAESIEDENTNNNTKLYSNVPF